MNSQNSQESTDSWRDSYQMTGTVGADKKSRSYKAWRNMHARCNGVSWNHIRHYAAKSINVCGRWYDYRNFLEDMGEPPPGYTLDRVMIERGYDRGNCRWATKLEQANNTSRTIWVSIGRRADSLAMWCRLFGLPYKTVYNRYRAGKREEELFAPRRLIQVDDIKQGAKVLATFRPWTTDDLCRGASDWIGCRCQWIADGVYMDEPYEGQLTMRYQGVGDPPFKWALSGDLVDIVQI